MKIRLYEDFKSDYSYSKAANILFNRIRKYLTDFIEDKTLVGFIKRMDSFTIKKGSIIFKNLSKTLNVSPIDIYFFPEDKRDGYEVIGGFALTKIDKSSALLFNIFNRNPKKFLFNFLSNKSTIIHELIHYFDFCRYSKKKKQNLFNKVDMGIEDGYNPDSKDLYYQENAEFNAFFQEAFDYVLSEIREILQEIKEGDISNKNILQKIYLSPLSFQKMFLSFMDEAFVESISKDKRLYRRLLSRIEKVYSATKPKVLKKLQKIEISNISTN